jgi:hypothetical protein
MTNDRNRAIDAVLDTLGPTALDEYLAYLPRRCSFCGFHPPTQGHAADCLDGPAATPRSTPCCFTAPTSAETAANHTAKTP